MLPKMKHTDKIRKNVTMRFSGLDRNKGAGDGAIWDTGNMTADILPVLSTRKKRWKVGQMTKPNGIYGHNGLWWVDGTTLYYKGVFEGTVEDSVKTFAGLNDMFVILPDKKVWNAGALERIEEVYTTTATIQDGTYKGEPAEANTIKGALSDNFDDKFKPGDGVTISGASNPGNNKTIIVREVTRDELRFYENSFTNEGPVSLTISRTMPDMDFLFSCNNRLWGAKGNTIYASALGDPYNWNVFDGLSTDSYAADVGSAGVFTGGFDYAGYPTFLKEDKIYKVYGDRPANWRVMETSTMGTEEGSGGSIAIANETAFFLGKQGFMAYQGGYSASAHAAFGETRFRNAVAGSDGRRYYVSAVEGTQRQLYVFDTEKKAWMHEDATNVIQFAYDKELYMLTSDGGIWMMGNAREIPAGATEEYSVSSYVEFGDFTGAYGGYGTGQPNRKGTSKIQLRLRLDANATVWVRIKYDDGVWEPVATLTGEKKWSPYLPIIPRRSDHYRIQLQGVGHWELYELTREEYNGSALH